MFACVFVVLMWGHVCVVQVPSDKSCWEEWACPLSLITPTTAQHCSCPPCPPAAGHSRVPHTTPYPSRQGSLWASDPSSCCCSFWSTRDSPCCHSASSNPTASALWTFSKVGYNHLPSVWMPQEMPQRCCFTLIQFVLFLLCGYCKVPSWFETIRTNIFTS